MDLLPSLRLTDPITGECVQLADNCMTLAAVRRSRAWSQDETAQCDTCCASCLDEGDYSGLPADDGAWWANDSDQGASGAVGLLVRSVELEPRTSVRRFGETTLGRPPFTPRQLTISGAFLGESLEGIYYLTQRYTRFLASGCAPCEGWEAEVQAFCPSSDTFEPTALETFDHGEEREEISYECWPRDCPDAPVLGEALDTPARIDTGARTLLRVRFVSFDANEEIEQSIESCFARDVVIRFEVFDDYEYGDLIGPMCADDDRPLVEDDFSNCYPYDFTHCLVDPVGLELCSVDSEPSSATDRQVEDPRDGRVANIRFRRPLHEARRSCLVPILPTGSGVVPVIDIWSGESPLSKLRWDIQHADQGWPAPDTCAGDQYYRNIAPCGRGLVGGTIPANSRLRLDGRSQTVMLWCGNGDGTRGEEIIDRWGWPEMNPLCRYWVTVYASCWDSDINADFDIYYAPRF